ncbi:RimJ/RimL family protein N-acetyltransferase [Jatrophihabitans sp. GAS493]|uniref:GNAT family N-acetyltransferase n=1 Tax=Jatrophihabitans sp. GAS493 TaxID=1907575 RepID=UPI000BB9324A|nr:GNAT family N-acetyltransferase [Jatrophihabitans sp. GAS493]SOD70926.1 RimJ/RimL family protein N-acetyltransferase [Jatrophihabitans sp. GAS493]
MTAVALRRWQPDDLWVLEAANTPEMTDHLGGPETDEKVRDRHRRYLAGWVESTSQMYTIQLVDEAATAGVIGFWPRSWLGEDVYEAGWGVLPEFQGRGVAVAALRALIDEVRAAAATAGGGGSRHSLHAYPSVDHPASNAICRRGGLNLVGECDFEYPPGQRMRCNDWQLPL